MELVDQDGDRLEFLIAADGKLREYVNGSLEIAEIKSLTYSIADATIRDDTGVFQLKPDEQVEKALGLRALASRAGVPWRGDEPAPATHVRLTDTDGDVLDFFVTDSGQMQELNNGELEIGEMKSLSFSYADGRVTDEAGIFMLPAKECMQKAAALRSLAMQAGVAWSGDEPGQVTASDRVMDIENCASEWEFQCPKNWASLAPTERTGERFCNTCREVVYFCSNEAEVAARTLQRRCVAFDVPSAAAGATAASSAAEVESDAVDIEADDKIDIRTVLLNGQELPTVRASPTETVKRLKVTLARVSGIPKEEQRLLVEQRELSEFETLKEACVTSAVTIQLLRVKPDPMAIQPITRRTMGRRAAPRPR